MCKKLQKRRENGTNNVEHQAEQSQEKPMDPLKDQNPGCCRTNSLP